MSGLIQKDIYTLTTELRYFILVLLVTFFMRNDFLYAFSILYATILPTTALAYDERSKWNALADMLPFTTGQIVGSKYILGYLLVGTVTLLLSFSSFLFRNPADAPLNVPSLLLTAACAALIALAIQLPIIFWIGMEKSRLLVLLIVMLTSGAASFASDFGFPLKSLSPALVLFIAFTSAAALNLISFQISRTIYDYRKAR